jgi:hypothetical protein
MHSSSSRQQHIRGRQRRGRQPFCSREGGGGGAFGDKFFATPSSSGMHWGSRHPLPGSFANALGVKAPLPSSFANALGVQAHSCKTSTLSLSQIYCNTYKTNQKKGEQAGAFPEAVFM